MLVQKLTPESLLGDPRRGPAVPNGDGHLALYSVSTYNFSIGRNIKEVKVMNIDDDSSVIISTDENVHDAVWIPGTKDEILYLKSVNNGATQAIVASAADGEQEHYLVANFDAPINNLKLKRLKNGSVAVVVTGLIENGELYNEVTMQKKSSVRVFDTPDVRMWNELYRPQRYTLWYSSMERQETKWKLSSELFCLIDDMDLEAPQGMYGLDNPENNIDISQHGVAFVGRRVSRRKPHRSGQSCLVYVPIESFSASGNNEPVRIGLPHTRGIAEISNVRITSDGKHLGFLHADSHNSYDISFFLAPLESGTGRYQALQVTDRHANSDREPAIGFEFAGSSTKVIFQSEQCGRSVLDYVEFGTDHIREHSFFRGGIVSSFTPLRDGDYDVILVSSSSFIDSSLWQIVRVSSPKIMRTVSSATKSGARFGLSANMVSEFWFKGNEGVLVHSFIIRPNNFDSSKKYPWVLRPHGGPVASWNDSWSIIANFALWAEQGYIVILPNISGSIGYGVDFCQRVQNERGGNPFKDLLHLIKHVESNPNLDQDKAVLMGGSFAGYMVNWFLGHEASKKFCCAVCHDGIFSVPTEFLQSDMIRSVNDWGKANYPWENPSAFEKWNPAQPELLRNWKNAPPTLISHGEKDYRCAFTEGLAAFNVLQAFEVPSRLVMCPDEGHFVENPENSLEWHRVVFDWVSRCVSGEIHRGSREW